jgi:hypothetical protein
MAKRKKKKTNWKKKADTQWSLLIRLHYKKCEICGKPGYMTKAGLPVGGLNAHHVISRGNLLFRHDPLNGQCLCVGCHKFSRTCSPHAGSIIGVTGYIDWMQDKKPLQWDWFNKNKLKRGKPGLTREETFMYLQETTNNHWFPPYDV